MGKDLKSTRKQLLAWAQKTFTKFIDWLKPNPVDSTGLQILKSILKIPVILIAVALSPVALIILGLIFFLVL